jgi:hypothetical protein
LAQGTAGRDERSCGLALDAVDGAPPARCFPRRW